MVYYGNGYSPYMSYNQAYGVNRNMYPETQYQQPMQQYGQQNVPQQQMQVLKGRPVASFDEAKASMIDLDGSLFVFPDISNKMIYTKQIMLDGSAEIKKYSLVEDNGKAQATQQSQEYVLRKDFEQIIIALQNKIQQLEGELKNEFTTGNVTNDAK